jgi:hypothetical protein
MQKTFKLKSHTVFMLRTKNPPPLLRDSPKIYGTLLEEMLHEYVVSDTFCSFSRQDREERIGAYEEIKMLVASNTTEAIDP